MTDQRAAVRQVVRDGVVVEGADALSWLQGQITQDVEAMGTGDTRHTLVLSPQGKVDSYCRVTRLADDRALLDVEAGYGTALLERLRRFKLRVKATLADVTVVCDEDAAGGFDALGPPRIVPEGTAEDDPVSPADEDVFEAARILAGVPRLGLELTERTIPQEGGDEFVARTVSFTKGCYTGQELVARLDSRGSNVPKRIRLARGPLPASRQLPRRGATIEVDGNDAGEVTSIARLGETEFVALALVKRAFLSSPTLEALLDADGDPVPATVSDPAGGRK